MIAERLHSMVTLIDSAILSVQRLSMALRPPALDDFGLNEAIKLVLTDFEKRTNITCEFIPTPQPHGPQQGNFYGGISYLPGSPYQYCPPCRGAKGYDNPAEYGRQTHYGDQG